MNNKIRRGTRLEIAKPIKRKLRLPHGNKVKGYKKTPLELGGGS
jgi:hypothetical protein